MQEEAAKGTNSRGIVLDSLMPTSNHRDLLLKMAEQYQYKSIAFIFTIEKEGAIFLDASRTKNKHRKHLSDSVGPQPINMFFNSAEEPTAAEGFQEIYRVNFVLNTINDEDAAFYNMLTSH